MYTWRLPMKGNKKQYHDELIQETCDSLTNKQGDTYPHVVLFRSYPSKIRRAGYKDLTCFLFDRFSKCLNVTRALGLKRVSTQFSDTCIFRFAHTTEIGRPEAFPACRRDA